MILKVWRILTIPSVINQLKKLISREREQQQEHNELNAGGHRQLGQEETILIKQRNDILISIDAILNRASIPYCKARLSNLYLVSSSFHLDFCLFTLNICLF